MISPHCLPHHLIKDKLIDITERTFAREKHSVCLVTKNVHFSLPMCTNILTYGPVKKFVKPLFMFWIIFFIIFGTEVYRQTIGIPMGTNCAPLVADLILLWYERDFMKSLSRENQADFIEAFNSTSRYLDDLINIDNIYFEHMADRMYPAELHLNNIYPFIGVLIVMERKVLIQSAPPRKKKKKKKECSLSSTQM